MYPLEGVQDVEQQKTKSGVYYDENSKSQNTEIGMNTACKNHNEKVSRDSGECCLKI